MKKQVQSRQRRVRAVLKKSGRPRLSVHRTSKHIWAQIIDDQKGTTLAAINTKALQNQGTKTEKAKAVGSELAKLGAKAKVKQVVFDRGSYRYHGRIKALADAAREGGLEF